MNLSIDTIKGILATNDAAVERAIVILFSRQTTQEVGHGITQEPNGKGFSRYTAARGTKCAKWILGLTEGTSPADAGRAAMLFLVSTHRGRPLTGWHLEQARKIAIVHARQILEVALLKQSAIKQAA